MSIQHSMSIQNFLPFVFRPPKQPDVALQELRQSSERRRRSSRRRH
ncbi:hypothetical protein [Nonomuraea sp. NPDC005501]